MLNLSKTFQFIRIKITKFSSTSTFTYVRILNVIQNRAISYWHIYRRILHIIHIYPKINGNGKKGKNMWAWNITPVILKVERFSHNFIFIEVVQLRSMCCYTCLRFHMAINISTYSKIQNFLDVSNCSSFLYSIPL